MVGLNRKLLIYLNFTFSLSIGLSFTDKLVKPPDHVSEAIDDNGNDDDDDAVLSAFNAEFECEETFPCLGIV